MIRIGGVKRLKAVRGGSWVPRGVTWTGKATVMLWGIDGAAGVQRLLGRGGRRIGRGRCQGA